MREPDEFNKQDKQIIGGSDQKQFVYAEEMRRAEELFKRLQESVDNKEKEKLANQFVEQLYIVHPDRVKREYGTAKLSAGDYEQYEGLTANVKNNEKMQEYHQAVLHHIIQGIADDVDTFLKTQEKNQKTQEKNQKTQEKELPKLISLYEAEKCDIYLQIFEDTADNATQNAVYDTIKVPNPQVEKDSGKIEARVEARKSELLDNPVLRQAVTYFYDNRYRYDTNDFGSPQYKRLFRSKFLSPYLKTIQKNKNLRLERLTDNEIKKENAAKEDNKINTENAAKEDNKINTDNVAKEDNIINADNNINTDNFIKTNVAKDYSIGEAPQQEEIKVRPVPGVYAKALVDLYGRLEATEHGLYNTARDSNEFTNLLNALKTLSDIERDNKLKGTETTHEGLRINNLKSAAEEYLAYCKKTPKDGSRRKTRIKNAERVLLVCEAWKNNVSPEEYLNDKIAANIYNAQRILAVRKVESSQMQEKNALFEKLYNPQYAKTAIKELKKTEAFARTVGQARNMFDRYHMYENKTKTLSKYSSAKRREVERNKSLEKRVKKKTTTMNQGGLNK